MWEMGKVKVWASWVLQIGVAVVLLQSLYFKFTGHPISVELFGILGVEPWGRFLVGAIELVTGVLLLIPQTAVIGAFMGILIGGGAILSHLFFIGISFDGDISLFLLAIGVFVFSIVILILRRESLRR